MSSGGPEGLTRRHLAGLAGLGALGAFGAAGAAAALEQEAPARTSPGRAGAQWVDVTRPPYGARGDGTGDDRPAIQMAIDAMAENERGGVVFLPPGTYMLSAPGLNQKTGVHLVGASREATRLKLQPRQNCSIIWADADRQGAFADCRVQSMTLDGDIFGQTDGSDEVAGIRWHNSRKEKEYASASIDGHLVPRCVIDDVVVQSVRGRGVHLRGYGDNWIINTMVSNTRYEGFALVEGFDNRVMNCIAAATGREGFLLSQSNTMLIGCKAYFTGEWSFDSGERLGHGMSIGGTCNIILGCEVQDTWGDGFRIWNPRTRGRRVGSGHARMNQIIGCLANGVGSVDKAFEDKKNRSEECAAFRIADGGQVENNLIESCLHVDRYAMWGGSRKTRTELGAAIDGGKLNTIRFHEAQEQSSRHSPRVAADSGLIVRNGVEFFGVPTSNPGPGRLWLDPNAGNVLKLG
ncbi:right-handed parallel beta-helix repeat-containing protein [Indioceanicola profundi]|uniref:right-handed parallel beta-helix repeat-containing protein n=1 Tax=Indioceanicola profundi TaxID=2220096 RepID=UPI000E6AA14A|nr:right-handed parallel beta-helix repeat-containing protein [Indioceanicola profundi]